MAKSQTIVSQILELKDILIKNYQIFALMGIFITLTSFLYIMKMNDVATLTYYLSVFIFAISLYSFIEIKKNNFIGIYFFSLLTIIFIMILILLLNLFASITQLGLIFLLAFILTLLIKFFKKDDKPKNENNENEKEKAEAHFAASKMFATFAGFCLIITGWYFNLYNTAPSSVNLIGLVVGSLALILSIIATYFAWKKGYEMLNE